MRPASGSAGAKHLGRVSAKAIRTRLPKGGRRTANKVAALLSALFAFAVKRRLALANPAKGVERFEEHARERFLKPAELPAFLAAVEAEGEPWRDYFMLCLLTGARRHAVASMAWADVDLDGAVWHIPAARSKNRQPISVALVSKAVELLARRWAEAVNAYVFPSATSGTGHVVEPHKPWLRVVRAGRPQRSAAA